jgi:hypothetical protein
MLMCDGEDKNVDEDYSSSSLTSSEMLKHFKLVMGTRRWNLTRMATFFSRQSGEDYHKTRRRCKALIKQSLEAHLIEYADSKRGVYRFREASKPIPAVVRNDKGTVGIPFNSLSVLRFREPLRQDFHRCHFCGNIPKFLQVRCVVFTLQGETSVVLCPACNRVITEV